MNRYFSRVAWNDIERVVLLFGMVGAEVPFLTGDTAEHLTNPNREVVDIHSTLAGLSIYLYGALLLGEIAGCH